MLIQFLDFTRDNSGKVYIGWNISDSTYGMPVIQNRVYQLIGNTNLSIDMNNIYDLDNMLERKFGVKYISHPKLYHLATQNGITTKNYIDGSEERKLFESFDYKTIELSTNRKVRIISKIADLFITNNLKVENMSARARMRLCLSDPIIQTVLGFLGVLITLLVAYFQI